MIFLRLSTILKLRHTSAFIRHSSFSFPSSVPTLDPKSEHGRRLCARLPSEIPTDAARRIELYLFKSKSKWSTRLET
jgi:hypothetical protein